MRYRHQAALAAYHTLAAEAVAETLLELETPQEAARLPKDGAVHILGAGSNTVFVGTVKTTLVRPVFQGMEIVREDRDSLTLRALAGTPWHDLVAFSVDCGLWGLENLALIPGTVGAAPVQNIGAYGAQCADTLTALEVFDLKAQRFLTLDAAECGFAYRHSRFKSDWRGRFLIVAAHFRLQKQGQANLSYPGTGEAAATAQEMFDRICTLRQQKLPDPAQEPNAGSFFHNPVITRAQFARLQSVEPSVPVFAADSDDQVKISAAWLIEQCGFKGRFAGRVGMSAQHALVLVNRGGSGAEILAYARAVQDAVYARFAITLTIEPEILGESP